MTADERIENLLRKAGVEDIIIFHDLQEFQKSVRAQIDSYNERLKTDDVVLMVKEMWKIIGELLTENYELVSTVDKMEAVIYNMLIEREQNDTPVQ